MITDIVILVLIGVVVSLTYPILGEINSMDITPSVRRRAKIILYFVSALSILVGISVILTVKYLLS